VQAAGEALFAGGHASDLLDRVGGPQRREVADLSGRDRDGPARARRSIVVRSGSSVVRLIAHQSQAMRSASTPMTVRTSSRVGVRAGSKYSVP
jgi:hypothetical protein